jgi:hypothetical protein
MTRKGQTTSPASISAPTVRGAASNPASAWTCSQAINKWLCPGSCPMTNVQHSLHSGHLCCSSAPGTQTSTAYTKQASHNATQWAVRSGSCSDTCPVPCCPSNRQPLADLLWTMWLSNIQLHMHCWQPRNESTHARKKNRNNTRMPWQYTGMKQHMPGTPIRQTTSNNNVRKYVYATVATATLTYGMRFAQSGTVQIRQTANH